MPVGQVSSNSQQTSSATTRPTLKHGAKGAAVKELQILLTRAGFDCGAADGSFGPRTTAAVQRFQRARGLEADGVVGPKSWRALTGGATPGTTTPADTAPVLTRQLRTGCKGEDVKQLQRLLAQAGYDAGTADGSFGARTAAAVRSYQRSRGLESDGVVGPTTWRALTNGAPRADTFDAGGTTGGPSSLQTPVRTGRTTTNVRSTSRALPVDAPLRSTAANRSAELYRRVVQQFDVESNPRHLPRGSSTYCNIFAWDVMRAMDVQLPHWVDAKGKPTAYAAAGAHELNANATFNWLESHGAEYGWRKVSMDEASGYANQGKPALVVWKNPNPARSGHVAVVIPSTDGRTHIAQAGGVNTEDRAIAAGSAFGLAGTIGKDCSFWVHA